MTKPTIDTAVRGVPMTDENQATSPTPARKPRGFATMSPERRSALASKGGKAAHALGTAHKWTHEEAQAAGRKGGSASRALRMAAKTKPEVE